MVKLTIGGNMNSENSDKIKAEVNMTNKEVKKSRKIIKRIISFDVYFQGLISSGSKVQIHHKAPMRQFAKSKNLENGTKEDFDRIFRLY